MRTALVIVLVVVGAVAASGQVDLLFAGLTDVQQTLQLNPASAQRYTLSIALPSVGVDFRNGATNLGSFLTDDGLRAQLGRVTDDLEPGRSFDAEGRVDLFGLAAKLTKGGLVSVHLSQRGQVFGELPREAARYVYRGNSFGEQEGVDVFKPHGAMLAAFELAVGYQTSQLIDGITLGGRVKLLHGQLQGRILQGRITTERTDTATNIVASGQLLSSGFAEEGGSFSFAPADVLLSPLNPGIGVDVGVESTTDDGWRLGASLLDIGLIRFGNRTQDFRFNAILETEGVAGKTKPEDDFQTVIDSVRGVFNDFRAGEYFETVEYGKGYTQVLYPRLVLFGERPLSNRIDVGARYGGRLRHGGMRHAVAVYTRGRVGRWFQGVLGYGVTESAYHMVGAGVELRFGPVQLYASSDDVLSLAMPERLRASSLRAGINLVFPVETDNSRGGKVDCYRF